MSGPLTVPVSQLTSFGAAKETTAGTFVAPAIFHGASKVTPSPKNTLIPVDGAMMRRGQRAPLTGAFGGTISFSPNTHLDAIGQLLAFAMGAQSTPSGTIINTTTDGATTAGDTAIPLTSTQGIQPGMKLVVDTSAAQETVTVATVTGTGIKTVAATTQNHSSGVAVTLTSTSAYLSKLTLGSRPYFSIEHNRGTRTDDYLGCRMSNFSLSIDMGKMLGADFSAMFINQAKQASPTSPTWPSKKPPVFDGPLNVALMFGSIYGPAGNASIKSVKIQEANSLKEVRSFAAGRNAVSFSEETRKFTGTIKCGFENEEALDAFLGNSAGATGPQSQIPGVALDFRLFGPDVIDATNVVNYGLHILTPNVTLETHNAPTSTSGEITQDFNFTCAESAQGANDDLTILLVNEASAVY